MLETRKNNIQKDEKKYGLCQIQYKKQCFNFVVFKLNQEKTITI